MGSGRRIESLEDAEDGGVDAHPERKRDHRHESEAGVPAQAADRIPEIVEHRRAPLVECGYDASMKPSRSRMTRPPYAALVSECVTWTMVVPC